MGDVALTIPALLSAAKAHPELTFTVITRPFFASFFPKHPQINAIGINLENYNGFFGINRLAKELYNQYSFDGVIDLHNVLRSKIITSYFKRKGIERVTLNKNRNKKKAIISGKSTEKMPHVVDQYLHTFKNAGYKSSLIQGPWLTPEEKPELTQFLMNHNLSVKQQKWIGIAPFAAHDSKVWGTDKVNSLIEILIKKDYKVFLFGGGKSEIGQLTALENLTQGVISVAGKIAFDQELALMKKLDALVCMDSSNMHFGCLLGIKVISIWGATTPLSGFYPLGNEEFMVQVPKSERKKLTLSRYGNKAAANSFRWQDHISMTEVTKNIG